MFLKIKTILVILLVDAGIIFAQQLPFSNQFLVNRHFLSPSCAGITGNLEAFLTYQKNTLHFPGGPEFKSLYASGPVLNNMSLGVSVSKSSVTIFNVFSAQGYYAYHLKMSEKQFLHFGLSFEYSENYLGTDKQNLSSQTDPYLLEYGYTLNAGFGLTYAYKTFQLGVVIPRMLGSFIRGQDRNPAPGSFDPKYSIPTLYRAYTSCLFNLTNSISLEPVIITELYNNDVAEPIWYNISALLRYKEITSLEFHYRQGEIMGFGLGFNPTKKILVHYSYDFSGSGIMKYSSGIQEISIGFLLGKSNKRNYQRSSFGAHPKQPYYDWIK